MERTADRLDAARVGLSRRRPQVTPDFVKTVHRAVGYKALTRVHGKIHEVENENVGVEAGHHVELTTERIGRAAVRRAGQRIRTQPARQAARWERAHVKASADFRFRQMTQEQPELKQNAVSRYLRKRRQRKKYQKEAEKAAKAAAKKAGKEAASVAGRTVRAATRFAGHHPVVTILVILIVLLVMIVQSCVGMAAGITSGIAGVVSETSYLAADADINEAELAYTEWETDLQLEAQNAPATYPGYDEYVYNIGVVGHDPYALMAYLTAVYGDYTYTDIEPVLREIFSEQYTLTFTESTETRYADTDGDGDLEPYEWRVLNVNLTAIPLSSVLYSRMDSDQQQHHDLLMQTKGNRQYVDNPFTFNWLPYVSSGYGYRISPATGGKEFYQGVDVTAPQGTEIHAGFDGTVAFAGEDGNSLMVVIDDGNGLVSKYAHCSMLLVSAGQTVKTGDVLGTVGSDLYLEVVKDGQTLNPLYFAVTGDDGSGYVPPGVGSASIVAVAASQIGNVGGAPYWSWYGFNGYVEWCACFVSWCADQCGYISAGIIPKFASCTLGIQWFQARGEWQGRNYVPAPGDLLYFDWQGDGVCDHVGIVEYVEGNVVHTIEGNTSNSCARRSYPLGSGVIVGYATPAYS